MKMEYVSRNGGEIEFSEKIPSDLEGYRLPQAVAKSAQDEYGTILWQKLGAIGFSVEYYNFFIEKEAAFTLSVNEPELYMQLTLANTCRMEVLGIGEMIMYERWYNWITQPFQLTTLKFAKPGWYSFAMIHFSENDIQRIAELFPGVATFLDRREQEQPAILWKQSVIASQEMVKIIDDMLYSGTRSRAFEMFLKAKMLEMAVVSVVTGEQQPRDRNVKIHDDDVERVYKTRELIEESVAEKLHTIDELAALMFVSENKLRKDFKKIYNMTVFDFMRHVRMEHAMSLLTETDLSISEIAERAGYENAFNFSAAFKKYFHYSPGQARRQSELYNLYHL
ncbi:MAG: AraC family transcriptional regulator [Chitinophagaceae bacterium]